MLSWLVQSDSTAEQLLLFMKDVRHKATHEKRCYRTKDESWRRARPEEVETANTERIGGSEVFGPEGVIRVQTFSCDSEFYKHVWMVSFSHVTDVAVALSHLFTWRSCWFAVCSALWVIIDQSSSQQISFAITTITSSINTGDLWPSAATPCLTDKAVIRSWIQWISFSLVTHAALMDVSVCVFECNQMFVVNTGFCCRWSDSCMVLKTQIVDLVVPKGFSVSLTGLVWIFSLTQLHQRPFGRLFEKKPNTRLKPGISWRSFICSLCQRTVHQTVQPLFRPWKCENMF